MSFEPAPLMFHSVSKYLPWPLCVAKKSKPGPRRIVVLAHVPLAHVGGLVAGFVQAHRPVGEGGGKLGEIIRHAVGVRVSAGEDRRPARRAERRRAEHVRKAHAFVGDAIDVRRLERRMPGAAHRVPADVVAEDEQDVGSICRRQSVAENRHHESKDDCVDKSHEGGRSN